MSNEEYESIYQLAMSETGGMLANQLIKLDLVGYSKWLSIKLVNELIENSTTESLVMTFKSGIYYKFNMSNGHVCLYVNLEYWRDELVFKTSRGCNFKGDIVELIWKKLNNIYQSLHYSRPLNNAVRHMNSFVKLLLYYTIYGKLQ